MLGWRDYRTGSRLSATSHDTGCKPRRLTLSPTTAVIAVLKWQPGCDAKYHGLGLMCIGPFHHHHHRPVREALIIPILQEGTQRQTEVRRVAVRDLGSTWRSPDSNPETGSAPQQREEGGREDRAKDRGAPWTGRGWRGRRQAWIKPMCRTVLGARSPAKELLWSKREA